jgi:hypothetical protein
MGYTHYWYRKKSFTQKQWEKVCMKVLDVVNFCDRTCTRVRGKILLAWEYDSPMEEQPTFFGGAKFLPKPPQVDNDVIRFNGWKDEGHETFMVTQKIPDTYITDAGDVFDFCKTNHKPYDMAVMLCLLVMSEVAPSSFRAESDGEWDGEWVPAREAYKELFGKEPKCPFARSMEEA